MKAISTYRKTISAKHVLLLVASSLTLATLSGCALNPSANGQSGNFGVFNDAVPAGPQLSHFFDRATDGSAASFADSPMGKNITVSVTGTPYFSASGFDCLHFQADHNTGSNPSNNVACRRNQSTPGDWVIERSVISMQKPQYINSSDFSQ